MKKALRKKMMRRVRTAPLQLTVTPRAPTYEEYSRLATLLQESEKALAEQQAQTVRAEQREGVYRAALIEVLTDLDARAQTVRTVLGGLSWDR